MSNDFIEFRSNVVSFLTSLRQSIDRPFRDKSPYSELERERFLKTMMMVEEARVRFNTYTRFRSEPTVAEWTNARNGILVFIRDFLTAEDIDRSSFDRRFRLAPIMRYKDEGYSSFVAKFIDSENTFSIMEAVLLFREYIENTHLKFNASQGLLTLKDLVKIVPSQQIAPAQFFVAENKIYIKQKSPKTNSEDDGNINAALDYLKSTGSSLIENLRNSNCDMRLLQNVKELHEMLTSDTNIVKIGLANMACGIMGAKFKDELPDMVSAMFTSYSTGIAMYVAQFPEWDQFAQKAASIDLGDDDVREIDEAAGNLVDILAKNPKIADSEVPKTISFVRQFLKFPGLSSKRAAFAMLRTIENLVASILHYSISLLKKTAEKTVEVCSGAASTVLVSLLGVALVGASGVGSAAIQAGTPWVRQAAEIVKQQIDKIGE